MFALKEIEEVSIRYSTLVNYSLDSDNDYRSRIQFVFKKKRMRKLALDNKRFNQSIVAVIKKRKGLQPNARCRFFFEEISENI